ncbi:MAG: hypothetical protein Q7V63_06255 [Gammaproteobacteria bacterium]|nr:hypothetical protein [Gammaproteobacteria bacterium]
MRLNLTTQLKEMYIPFIRAAKQSNVMPSEYAKLKEKIKIRRNDCIQNLKSNPELQELLDQYNLEEKDIKQGSYLEYIFLWNMFNYASFNQFEIHRISEKKNQRNPDFLIKSKSRNIVVELSAYDLPSLIDELIHINEATLELIDKVTSMCPELNIGSRILTQIIGYKQFSIKVKNKVAQLNEYCSTLTIPHGKVIILDAYDLVSDDRLMNADFFDVLNGIVSFIDNIDNEWCHFSNEILEHNCIILKAILDISAFLKVNNTMLLFSLKGIKFTSKHDCLIAFNGDEIFSYTEAEFSDLSQKRKSIYPLTTINIRDLHAKAMQKNLLA